MRQAGVFACLIIRALGLVIELQRKLDIPWRLGSRNLPHRSSKTHVWCVELHMVKGIDEVGPELKSEPLREQEVLVQAHVYVGVMRSAQSSELWSAVAKRPHSGVGEVPVIGEPLVAAHSCGRNRGFSSDRWEAIAIGARPSRERAGFVCGSLDGHREARAEGENRANRPAARDGVKHFVHVAAELLAVSDGQFINGIG